MTAVGRLRGELGSDALNDLHRLVDLVENQVAQFCRT